MKLNENEQHFSIRKLTVGAASVLIGTTFYMASGSTVKADTVNDSAQTEQTITNAQADDQAVNTQSTADDQTANTEATQGQTTNTNGTEAGNTQGKTADNTQTEAPQTGNVDPSSANQNSNSAEQDNGSENTAVGIKADSDNPGTKTVTRTITFDGAPQDPVVQKVNFSRVDNNGNIGYRDPVTNKITYNEWLPSEGSFTSYTPQTFTKDNVIYTPEVKEIPKQAVNVNDKDIAITVKYNAQSNGDVANQDMPTVGQTNGDKPAEDTPVMKTIIIYKDADGNIVGTEDVNGKPGDKVNLKLPDGYYSDNNSATIPDNGVLTINVAKKKSSNGEDLTDDTNAKPFEGSVSGIPETAELPEYHMPSNDNNNATDDNDNNSGNVDNGNTSVDNGNKGNDNKGNSQASDTNDSNAIGAGSAVDTGSAIGNSNIGTNEAIGATANANSGNNELPQTGSENDTAAILAGAAASAMSALGLIGAARKRRRA